ncbi:hypothetical protein RND81_11G007000 [Saponaria officinalis]|uniref:Uncharacterized protein n=1 Tax=Saponaria officinalis TaxID=3572 RepID=A0AAW1HGU6_SAPOF
MVSLNSFTFAVNLQSTQTLLKMFAYMLYRRRRTSKLNLLPRPFLMFGLSGCILTKKRTLHIPSPRRGTNTSQKKSRNRITVVECSNQQRPPRRRRTSKAKGNARGSRQAKTTVKKRRPEIKGSKHIDKSRLRRKRAKTAAEDNVTEQSEVRICGAAVGNGFCHQSEHGKAKVYDIFQQCIGKQYTIKVKVGMSKYGNEREFKGVKKIIRYKDKQTANSIPKAKKRLQEAADDNKIKVTMNDVKRAKENE